MKLQTLLLAFLSVGLVSAIAYIQRPVKMSAVSMPVVESVSNTTAGHLPATTPASGPKAGRVQMPFSWRELESDDYHKYIANLRAFGCPEQTIRDIVMADVNKLYAAREEPLKKPPQTAGAQETPEQRLERLKQLRSVQEEKRWTIKELLGIDMPLDVLPSSGPRDYHAFEVALKSLPQEKRDAVQNLQETYWQQADALDAKYQKQKTRDYVTESRQLKDTLRQELSKVLSPQELEDYDLRTSPTAKQLSDKLGAYFHPSETEFRQIFRAKTAYDDTMERLAASQAQPPADPTVVGDPAALAQQRAADRQALQQGRTAALSQMNDQLKTALGDSRYTEYERSQDRTYDLLARLGMRYNLPQDTVQQAYDFQKSFKPDPVTGTDPAAAAAAQAQAQQQLNDRLNAILGDRAARGYRRVNGGSVPLPSKGGG
jgi:hypothetical protein